MAVNTTPGGNLYDTVNGVKQDEDTALNRDARDLEVASRTASRLLADEEFAAQITGPAGPAPDIYAGTTTQVDAGTPASVDVVQTGEGVYRADFTIPKGADGDGTGMDDASVASHINTVGSSTQAALNAQIDAGVQPSLDALEADKLDRTELTPALDAEVPPLVSQALAADSTPAQAAADAAADAVDAQLGAVKPLFDRSTNLFARGTSYWNRGFAAGAAEPSFSGTNGVSDFIGVTAGKTYVFGGGISRVTWFDSARVYLSDSGGVAQGSTRVAPAGAFFARVSLPMDSFDVGQMNEGSVLLPYEEGRQTQVTSEAVPRQADIAPVQTTFFNLSSNLFELDTTLKNMSIPAGSGTPVATADYQVSDWIPVTPLTEYTYFGALLRATYYDQDRTRVAEVNFSGAGITPATETTNPRVKWVRITVADRYAEDVQMNLGPTVLPYEPGGATIKPERLPSTPGPDPEPEPSPELVRPILDEDVSGLWQATTPAAESSFISSSTPQDVYAAYDALVTAHPDYVTRTQPGASYNGDFPIYAYTFSQPGPDNTAPNLNPTPRAKVILVTATHGNERAPVWSVHEMVKRMCEDWGSDRTLAALRFNVDLIVVPVANPTGYRDNTRITANGVDPARNWPTGWSLGDPQTTTYGGPEPLSEPETLAMKVILDDNPDSLAVIDYHNFHTSQYVFLYGTPANMRSAELVDATVRRMDRAWKASEPTIVNQDPGVYIGYTSGAPGGSIGPESVARGHDVGMTFEMCWKVPTEPGAPTYSALTITWGMEAIVNLLTLTLRNA